MAKVIILMVTILMMTILMITTIIMVDMKRDMEKRIQIIPIQ